MGHYTSRRLWNLYSAGRLWSPTTGQAYGQAGLFQRYILWRIMTGCCHLACAEISILLCHTQSGQTKDLNRTTRSTHVVEQHGSATSLRTDVAAELALIRKPENTLSF